MGKISLADVFCAKLDLADLIIAGLARDRADLEFIARDRDNIEIVKINCVAGVSDNRAHVAGEKILILTDAEHERRTATRTNHELFDVGVNERDAVGAEYLLKGSNRGVDQASLRISAVNLLINTADYMRQYFSIGVGSELVTAF